MHTSRCCPAHSTAARQPHTVRPADQSLSRAAAGRLPQVWLSACSLIALRTCRQRPESMHTRRYDGCALEVYSHTIMCRVELSCPFHTRVQAICAAELERRLQAINLNRIMPMLVIVA